MLARFRRAGIFFAMGMNGSGRSVAALAVAVAIALLTSACGGGQPLPARNGSPSGGPTSPEPSISAGPSTFAPPSITPSPLPTHSRHQLPTSPPAPTTPTPPEPALPDSLLDTQWFTLPTSEKVLALTFDAGANADAVPSILQTLAQKGVPATFFLTGKWAEAYPDFAAEIGSRYPVGNHSYSHPDLTRLSDDEVREEITEAASAIQSATGRDTHPMFRFPFGASDQRTIDLVNSLGYGAINWTVDTRGWQGTSGGQSVDLIVQRVLDGLQPGEIVIMHVGSNPDDGSTLDADALPRVIDQILARGYRFVTVDQFL